MTKIYNNIARQGVEALHSITAELRAIQETLVEIAARIAIQNTNNELALRTPLEPDPKIMHNMLQATQRELHVEQERRQYILGLLQQILPSVPPSETKKLLISLVEAGPVGE